MNPAIREAIEKAISTCWPKSVAHGQCNDCEAHHAAIRNLARVVIVQAEDVAYEAMMKIHAKDGISCGTVNQADVRAAIRALMPEEVKQT